MRKPILSLAILLGMASAGQAQETCIEQLKFPEVGRWAEYKAVYNQKDPYTIRYAVVGGERREGKDLKWLELRMVPEKKDGTIIYQMLVPGSAAEVGEVEEIISDIIDEDRRAGEVIRGLRELLRKGQGTQEELDVNGLVRGVLRLLGNDVMLRGVSMRSELTDESLTTRGDRVQLQQVLLNLVVNALEALADSDGDRRIGIRTERAAGMARVSVEDSGPGLPGPVEREIFKPFFTTRPKGMGMGLSIARSILGAHGGTISVDRGRERGARFSFTLPLVEAGRAPRA